MTEEDLIGLVSFHAVTRYVQRVLGVEVVIGADEWPSDAPRTRYEAKRHAEAAGLTIDAIRRMILTPPVALTIDAIRRMILTPPVALAAAMKMSAVSTRDFQAKLINGCVVTITAPRGRPDKRLRVLSRREGKDKAQQHHRQAKRRPATCR